LQNVIEFLQRQNAQFGTAIDELASVRAGLTGTRCVMLVIDDISLSLN
jgi:hypothetical protein